MFCCCSIDATMQSSRLGRLVNHCKRGAAVTKVLSVDGKPHLCIFAIRDMKSGEQVLYDYGVAKLPFTDLVSLFRKFFLFL